MRAHADLQPVLRAGEYPAAEVQRDGEDPVRHDRCRIGERAADLAAAAVGVKQREYQIERPVGRRAIGVQEALIGECRGLRQRSVVDAKEQKDCEQIFKSGFHISITKSRAPATYAGALLSINSFSKNLRLPPGCGRGG
jgi:hypothetical protein